MENKTKKNQLSPFSQNLRRQGEIQEKLNNLALPFGFSVMGALTGAGTSLLATQYVWADNNQATNPELPEDCEVLQQQPLPPPNPQVGVADVCSHNLDHLPFGKAFAAARNECGPGAVFIWQGRPFNTFYKEEWASLTNDEKTEFNTAVANLNGEINQVITQNDYQMAADVQPILTQQPSDQSDDPDDGKDLSEISHMAIDTDADGYYETIVFLDQNGNVEQIAIDTDHSGSTETHLTNDEIIGILTPEEQEEEQEEEEQEADDTLEPLFMDGEDEPANLNPMPTTTLTNLTPDPDFDPNADVSELI